ncbi:DUF3284 domain-containing protein [Lacticaseibacillus saniviri]|uniref:DUF3284 domain-containing protein n=1 Tax=Lacticaseibacillus saniviri JCM 17471 = DSM 24301 TaxID=1293598 RepID=A0A0R2MWV3_9LACO|nr:DUF3284 domain-containing protein [Lacticaseibacillus saniviri]KRO16067.1 hypothetical protein IV56_GL002066 [Lacticaseibacillus saniviri JCM 17471 = DSM 24301]MCG4282802.1 DUF3284 domain-containing protein [Lacticaseibacillus saniviri]
MKIVKTLDIPADYFYTKVIDSVIYDIKEQTGQQLPVTRLEGFEYKKQFARGRRAKVKITKNVINQAYHFETITPGSVFKVNYDIAPTADNRTQVTYEEKSEMKDTLSRMNQALIGMLFGFFRKRNFGKMLTAIEKSYTTA